jgi:hypothetical protein
MAETPDQRLALMPAARSKFRYLCQYEKAFACIFHTDANTFRAERIKFNLGVQSCA